MDAPIVVYGATGYTGRLVAEELTRREVPFLLAGRNQSKLEALADQFGTGEDRPEIAAIQTSDSQGLRELFARSSAVIACAGPFIHHGEPVLAAAVEAGVPYVDTTGEQDFVRRAFEVYGGKAEAAGTQVMTAMGFDYVPGEMLAALTAEVFAGRAIDKVRLGYYAPFQPSQGTMRTSIEMFQGGDVEWRDGALRPASQKFTRPDFDFGGELGVQKMMRFPTGEHVTVAAALSPRSIETGMAISSIAPGPSGRALSIAGRGFGAAMRTPLKKAMHKIIERLPEGADLEARKSEKFTIGCEVTSGHERAFGTITGTDVYGLTAAFTVEAAVQAARGEITRSGALAPSMAFDPTEFLGRFAGYEISWQVEQIPA